MLTKFGVNNYKCLVGVEFPLTPIHVIIGENDSGKTSVLEAMLALSKTVRMTLAGAFAGEWQGRELVYEREDVPVISFEAKYEGVAGGRAETEYRLSVDFSDSRLPRVMNEYVNVTDCPNLEPMMLNSPAAGHTTLYEWWHERQNIKSSGKTLASQLGPALMYRLDPRAMATPSGIDSDRKFRMDMDGFGLATLLDDMLGHDAKRFLAVSDEFCRYFPQFETVRVETERATVRKTDKTGRISKVTVGEGKGIYLVTKHGTAIRAQQASDGAILFLGFLALMHSPDPPKLLLIEEPEKGVYPKRLEQIVKLFRHFHATRPAGSVPQIVMTTHSPFLLSFFKPEEVTFLSRRDKTGPVRARPLRDAPHIHERLADGAFYLGELWYNLPEEELFGDA